jgi:hypothetical protein
MSTDSESPEFREAVGLFTSFEALQGAIDELLSSGFDRADLSLLGSESAIANTIGPAVERAALEDDRATPRGAYVSPDAIGMAEGSLISGLAYVGGVATAGVIAIAGAPLTTIFLGAGLAGGVGGLIGAGLARVVGDRRAGEIRSHLEAGGLLLWVRTWRLEDERRAVAILTRHSGRDVHVHSAAQEVAARPSSMDAAG